MQSKLSACVLRSNLGNKRTRFTHSHHRMAHTLRHFCSYSSIGTDTRCCSNGAGFLFDITFCSRLHGRADPAPTFFALFVALFPASVGAGSACPCNRVACHPKFRGPVIPTLLEGSQNFRVLSISLRNFVARPSWQEGQFLFFHRAGGPRPYISCLYCSPVVGELSLATEGLSLQLLYKM